MDRIDKTVAEQGQDIQNVKNEVNEQGQRLEELEEVVDETVEKVEEIDHKVKRPFCLLFISLQISLSVYFVNLVIISYLPY